MTRTGRAYSDHYYQETHALQMEMSNCQAYPCLGFIFVSPFKAVVSAVELVVGAIFAVIFGIFSCHSKTREYFFIALAHCELGLMHLAYSVANMGTLGLFGYCATGREHID